MAMDLSSEETYDDEFSIEDDFDGFSDTLDYSQRHLTEAECNQLLSKIEDRNRIINCQLNSNSLLALPNDIEKFQSLITLELSNNQLVQLSHEIGLLANLKNLYLKNNFLNDMSFPKELQQLKNLEVINLAGNRLKRFPYHLFQMLNLKEIYLGSNQIVTLPDRFQTLTKVELLYLGANQIALIPDSIGYMHSLVVLNLCDNRLRTLPRSIARLTRLKSLSLHNNQFSALPPDIIRLDLQELSLRNNPLVVRFVHDLTYDVPSLKELAGRTIKLHKINYTDKMIPKALVEYLNSAKSCVNPKCQGVYFESCHKNIKFVDFCGKFYLPLLQFLCSPACTSASTNPTMSTTDSDNMNSKFRKVLLG